MTMIKPERAWYVALVTGYCSSTNEWLLRTMEFGEKTSDVFTFAFAFVVEAHWPRDHGIDTDPDVS